MEKRDMSKHETPMTRRLWEREKGTLLEEYCIVSRSLGTMQRVVDAIIIKDGDHRIASRRERVSLDGHDIVVIQTKARCLGMNLLGQALFSRELVKARFAPRSIRAVAVCAADDAALRPIAERFGVEVVVDDLPAEARNMALYRFDTPLSGLNLTMTAIDNG
jgi:hypothetical protein